MADASAEMKKGLKKAVDLKTFITLAVIVLLFGYLGYVMGMDIVFSVMIKTRELSNSLDSEFCVMALEAALRRKYRESVACEFFYD